MKNWNEIRSNQDIADACEDAADLLEGHWTTGEWYHTWDEELTPGGEVEAQYSYCIEGALGAALGLDVASLNSDGAERRKLLRCPAAVAVVETLNLKYGDERWGEDDLPAWNDNEATEQEAIDLLRATAKRVLGVPM